MVEKDTGRVNQRVGFKCGIITAEGCGSLYGVTTILNSKSKTAKHGKC